MLSEQLYKDVVEYVNSNKFKSNMDLNGALKVQYLAQGEYNLNYLLETNKGRYVLRINTASQLKLDNQIGYEYQALSLLSHSGVTPKPYYLDDSKTVIPYGLLVMEYLPGEPLDYRYDLLDAASTFARIHSLKYENKETEFLIREPGPFTGIYNESVGLLQKYFECVEADIKVKQILEKVILKAQDKKKEEFYLQSEPWLAVINTEVNSHNFIIDKKKSTCHLIDWEKPILGEPAQDLSMFLISTTTMWKRSYRLSLEEEESFLRQYLNNFNDSSLVNTLRTRVEMFKFFNYLRAISWCAMAWTEYIKPGRLLANIDTFEKIKIYLEPEYLKQVFQEF